MKNIFLLSLILLLSWNFTTISAQKKYTTKSKKAIKEYELALQSLSIRDNKQAIEYLNKAILIDANFIEAHMLKGDCSMDLELPEQAITAYSTVIQVDKDFSHYTFFYLANAQIYAGKYAEAKENYLQALAYPEVKKKYENLINKYLKNCEFGIWAMKNPVPFTPVNLGKNINTKHQEYLPSITLDNQNLIITRRLPKDSNQLHLGNQEDFYFSKKDKFNRWTKAYPVGYPVNTNGNEGAQCLSADGKMLFFTACQCEDGIDRCCDIYVSLKQGNKWQSPMNLGEIVNSPSWDYQPSFSADGKTLFFSSNRSGTLGKHDIYKTVLKEDGTWTIPENLGDSINTPGEDCTPFIHPDGKTLYFTSEGHVGMGGYDIYVSRMDSNGVWHKPKNIGYPINTPNNESCLILTPAGDSAYFASDRLPGFGGYDIFRFAMPPESRPIPVNYMKGNVFDKETKAKIGANFELINLKTGKSILTSVSDKITGEFLVALPLEEEYLLNVSAEGYLFYSQNFDMKNREGITEPLLLNIPLQSIRKDKNIVLRNIFFDRASFQLKNTSFPELDKLLNFLTKNANLVVEIQGHTDNEGTADYNLSLSENRAKSVCQYLINKGIDKKRLSYKGYGFSVPVADNTTTEGRAQNRRTEVKILN